MKTKRAPPGYSYIGEINYHSVCIKYSQIPNAQSIQPPPIPPRPTSIHNKNNNLVDQDGFVHLDSPANSRSSLNQNNNDAQSSHHQMHNSATYNPLQGVQFEINPAYNLSKNNNNGDDFTVSLILNVLGYN
jgi:hypothetical protein